MIKSQHLRIFSHIYFFDYFAQKRVDDNFAEIFRKEEACTVGQEAWMQAAGRGINSCFSHVYFYYAKFIQNCLLHSWNLITSQELWLFRKRGLAQLVWCEKIQEADQGFKSHFSHFFLLREIHTFQGIYSLLWQQQRLTWKISTTSLNILLYTKNE